MEGESNIPENRNTKAGEEIDILRLINKIRISKKYIIKFIIGFTLLGIITALLSKDEFEASVKFIPQESEGMNLSGGLGGLAAMAGFNLNGAGSSLGVPSELYPEIMNSLVFQKQMLEAKITMDNNDRVISFRDYYLNLNKNNVLDKIKKYTLGLPGLIINLFKKDTPLVQSKNTRFISTSKDERNLINILENQLVLDVNLDEGTITLVGKMPEALASAEFTDYALNLLQKNIIDIRIQKSKEQLLFIETRLKEKTVEFKKIQKKVAVFRDKNRNVNSAYAKTKLDILESEYELAYSMYSELAKQYETQKIKVKEDTPVFTVINPISIPFAKSKPQRIKIVMICSFLGFVIGVASLFIKEYFFFLKGKFDEME